MSEQAGRAWERRPGRARSRRRRTWRAVPTYAVIFIGGAAGGSLRFVLGEAFPDTARAVPWTTFTINIAGAYVLAVLLVLATEALLPHPLLRPALGTGVLGAFTTFSTFVVAADRMLLVERWPTAAGYVLGSTLVGLVAAGLGLLTGRVVVTAHHRRREA